MGEKKKTGTGGHQALYRKYRSKAWDEIIGQEHITNTLKNALKQGKISHAYLFTGPRGTGKTSVARILAHEINNLPYEDEKSHLDIIEIDAASNRRIDDVRDLRDKVHIAPVSAKYKVYIIDEVHMLTTESFNALLKTLEEPPAHVVFILATTEVHKLPATIISRTQRHSFRLIPHNQLAAHLGAIAKQEGLQAEPAALELLAGHGGGSPRDSISLLDQLSGSGEPITVALVELLLGLAPKDSLQQLLKAALDGDSVAVIADIESLLESGLTPGGIAAQLLGLIREQAKAGSNQTQLIQLMADLLGVHSAQYPQLKLETILLGLAPSSAAPRLASTPPAENPPQPPRAAKPQPKAAPETPTAAAPATPKAEKTTAAKPPAEVEAQWPAILSAIKQQNNPLYTVLRLATPELNDDGLLLIFSFPFHQKKANEAKHKTLIAETVNQVTGQSVEIQTLVDKDRARPAPSLSTAAAADPAHASLIKGVQDIMGGGEVVHV